MSKFPLASAALAVSGLAFFAGSLVAINLATSGAGDGGDLGEVSRGANPALLSEPVAEPADAASVASAPAALPAGLTAALTASVQAPAPAPAPVTSGAAALTNALSASVRAPGAAVVQQASSRPQPQALPADTKSLIQQASQAFRVIGNAEGIEGNTKRVVLVGIQTGKDEEGLQTMLGQAARSGLIAVPEGLTRADGEVDTRSLLLSIVEQAVSESEAREATERQIAQIPEPAPQPAARRLAEPVVYTVEAGDSLAYIALQYYGSTTEYQRIFNANRDQLTNPNRISVGQRLVIPASS